MFLHILEYFGIFWNILECSGIFWNILEYSGIFQIILEYFVILSGSVGLKGFSVLLCMNESTIYQASQLIMKNCHQVAFQAQNHRKRAKTVIFSLSRLVQRQYGCQNFRNLSQNSNLLVWCSTIQSRRSSDGKTVQNQSKNHKKRRFCKVFPSQILLD